MKYATNFVLILITSIFIWSCKSITNFTKPIDKNNNSNNDTTYSYIINNGDPFFNDDRVLFSIQGISEIKDSNTNVEKPKSNFIKKLFKPNGSNTNNRKLKIKNSTIQIVVGDNNNLEENSNTKEKIVDKSDTKIKDKDVSRSVSKTSSLRYISIIISIIIFVIILYYIFKKGFKFV